jgi:hypothetical protein
VRGPRKPKKKSLVMTRDLYDANGKIKPIAGQRFK